MKRARFAFLMVAVFGAAFLITACGGSGPSSELSVKLSDFKFDPSTYEVSAGTEVPLTLTNEGGVEHEWVIMKSPIDSEDQFEEDLVLWEEEVGAGESKTVTIPTLEAGTYQIICGIEGHFSAGMEGELTVSSGS